MSLKSLLKRLSTRKTVIPQETTPEEPAPEPAQAQPTPSEPTPASEQPRKHRKKQIPQEVEIAAEIEEEESKLSEVTLLNGKDEMNLAEFPFATLTHVPSKGSIVYESQRVGKDGEHLELKWIVSGSTTVGLPTEFDERFYVALMKVTTDQDFRSKKAPFSIYKCLKIMGESDAKAHYVAAEKALDRLKGVTIKAEGAFWDNEKKELVHTVTAFNLIDRYWLRYREKDEKIREEEGVPAYIIWNDVIWNSFKSGYIKNLDLRFYYGLQSPIARRLYRFLDKRMWDKVEYEFDLFDLASRLGMTSYKYPSKIREKLQPAIDELIAKGFLTRAEFFKKDEYHRIRFVRPAKTLRASKAKKQAATKRAVMQDGGKQRPNQSKQTKPPIPKPSASDAQREEKRKRKFEAEAELARESEEFRLEQEKERQKALARLQKTYGTTQEELDLWEQALTEIKGSVSEASFRTWFPHTHLLAIKDGVAIIGVPNDLTQERLGHPRLRSLLRRVLGGLTKQDVELKFVVLGSKPPIS